MSTGPILTHVTYIPKKGSEDELFKLVEIHWATIHDLGLTTDEPAIVYKATDKRSGAKSFIEIFSWKDEAAGDMAHQIPEVMAVWEPMGPLMEDLQLLKLDPVGVGA